ncbi:uncharacterized protein K452DRAFT_310914 [Aplosporella prunicola CBS 121167]|uniref:Uncharacterized protein n=1 Tax=Aplosporella prunicola CBS 121167 TaxID=1176127 RepID=A0A6A6B4Z9_9PEZI|nr:uncharacterized protein K452DRAFT_310914 [Aplosporella prunicola CBS 121167]KAF2138946.1 hypothetical protein K452DRAFT_310914 [Aplosporella prunicola CBS 121167]
MVRELSDQEIGDDDDGFERIEWVGDDGWVCGGGGEEEEAGTRMEASMEMDVKGMETVVVGGKESDAKTSTEMVPAPLLPLARHQQIEDGTNGTCAEEKEVEGQEEALLAYATTDQKALQHQEKEPADVPDTIHSSTSSSDKSSSNAPPPTITTTTAYTKTHATDAPLPRNPSATTLPKTHIRPSFQADRSSVRSTFTVGLWFLILVSLAVSAMVPLVVVVGVQLSMVIALVVAHYRGWWCG